MFPQALTATYYNVGCKQWSKQRHILKLLKAEVMKRLRSQWRNQMSCTAAWLLLYSPNTQSAGRRVCVSVNNRCCFLQTQGLVLRLPNEKAALSTIRRRNRPVLSLTHHEHPTSGLILTFTQKWKYCQVFPNPSFLPWNTKDDALNNVKVISPPYAITMNEALKLKKIKQHII